MEDITGILRYTVFLLSLFIFSNLFAQEPGDELDPFMGSYILGNSAEIFLMSAPDPGFHSWQKFDYNRDPAEIIQKPPYTVTDPTGAIAGGRAMDITSCDLDGDRHDDIIYAWESANHSIRICMESVKKSIVMTIDSVLDSRIRVLSGDFDRDCQKEFVLAYHGLDGFVHISLYQTDDSLLVLEKTVEIADIALESGIPFDLAAGDFDYDGLDEIVLINYIASDAIGSNQYRLKSGVKVYDYDYQGQNFIPHTRKQISAIVPGSNVPRLVIAAGNFDADAQDEVVYGYEANATSILTFPIVQKTTAIYNGVSTFNIDPSLDAIDYDEDRTGEISNWKIISMQLLDEAKYYTAGFSMSIACSDLNANGIDEVIGYGSRNLMVFSIGQDLTLTQMAQIEVNAKYGSENCRQLLAVSDLDADTTAAQGGIWRPEIVYFDFTNDPLDDISNIDNPGKARLTVCQLSSVVVANFIIPLATLTTDIDGSTLSSCVIATGDFDGDAVRLGKPRLFSRESVVQPTVILNAPPVHYDILNDIPYDVCFSYNANEPEFVSTYEYTTRTDQQVETEVHADWGVSASLSAGGSFLGIGARATLTAKYGEGFSKSALNRHSVVIEQKAYARVDDEIYATVTDYSLWEYPVYFKGDFYGYVLAAIPYFKGNNWFPSKSWTGISHIPNHEVGNILSYPYYDDVTYNPELNQLLYNNFDNCELYGGSQYNMALTFTEFTSISELTSWDFGMSFNTSVWGGGISLSTEAQYNTGEINTHTTSISEQFSMTIDMYDIDAEIGEVNYKVQPYAYRSQNGAIVIDYNVEIPEAAPGYPVTWWQSHYSDNPDPSFILPWLYDPEKGYTLQEEAKRYLTKEITFNPDQPQPGDTVKIMARLHNYSLIDTDNPVAVRFYKGDPDAGGTPISSIYGETEVTTPAVIASRDVAYVEMYWQVPADISEYSRIYALIDPDNNLAEIHENNNKGFVTLSLWGATAIEEIVTNDIPDKFTLYQNYPNPFNPITTIRFSIPKSEKVKIEIYNIIGQRIKTLLDENMPVGSYEVKFDGQNIASGLYLYKIQAGEWQDVRKMILIK